MKGKEWAGVKEGKRKVKTRFLSGETPLPNMMMIICFWLCIILALKSKRVVNFPGVFNQTDSLISFS